MFDTHFKKSTNSAFTMLELVIAITIISLISGGVFVGQSMVKNSKFRSIAMEEARFVKSAKMFQDKYYSLPGDMNNAESMWGTASGGCPWGARSGTQTCSGDGNGKVALDAGSAPDNTRELFTFWQHMAIAGMMEEPANGISSSPAYGISPGTNVPKSAWSGAAGWNVIFVGKATSSSTYYDGSYGHILMLGQAGFNTTSNALMTPSDQVSIDNKFDDGKASTGNIRAVKDTYVGACISGSNYDLTQTGNVCAPIWITGF